MSDSVLVAAAALAAGFGAAWWWLSRQWGAPLREIERILSRWAVGELAESILPERLGPARRLAAPLERARAEQWRCFNEGLREVTLERLRLEALVRQIDLGIVICSMRGDILRLNPAASRLLGIAIEDSAGYKSLESRGEVQRVLKQHTQSDLVEMPRAGHSGASAYVTVSVLSTGNNDDVCVLLILRDASAKQRLERVNEEFFQSVAEQLRAPMAALQGYVGLLLSALGPDQRQRGYVDGIKRACDDLSIYLQDALDSARLEIGSMTLSAMPMDVGPLLRRLGDAFVPVAAEKGARIQLKIADERPASIDVDERILSRLLQRLLTEALSGVRRESVIELGVGASGPARAEFWVAEVAPAAPASGAAAAFEAAAAKIAVPVREASRSVELCRRLARLHGGDLITGPKRWIVTLPVKQWPSPSQG